MSSPFDWYNVGLYPQFGGKQGAGGVFRFGGKDRAEKRKMGGMGLDRRKQVLDFVNNIIYNQNMNEETLLTVSRAAEIAGCSGATLRRAIYLGNLPARRYGREWLINPDDLEKWVRDFYNPNMAREHVKRRGKGD